MAYSCSRVSGSDAVNSCSSSFFIHSWYLSHNTLHNYQWKYRYCNDVRSYLSMWDLLFQIQVKSDHLFSVLKSFIRLRQNWTRKSWCVCVKCLRIIPHPCVYYPRHKASIEDQCRRQEFKNRGPRKLRMWCKSLHHLHQWRQRFISVAGGHDPTPSLATLSLTAYESYVSIHNTSGRGVPLIFVP